MSLNQHPECMHQAGDFQEEADKGEARMGNTFLCTQKQFCFALIHRFNSGFDTINNWPRTLCKTSRTTHGSQTSLSSTKRFPEFRLVVCLPRIANSLLWYAIGICSISFLLYVRGTLQYVQSVAGEEEQVAEEAACLCPRLWCGGSSVALLRSPGHRQHTTYTQTTVRIMQMQRTNLMWHSILGSGILI